MIIASWRRRFWAACLLASGLWLCPGMAAASPKLNVILILLDDFGWADLGCYGSTFYRTPNIDRLASQGMRFTDAYAAGPVCSPTRASIVTGRYPARLHLTDWLPGRPDSLAQKWRRPLIRQELPLEEITIAEALKAGGYTCGHIGKWHLGGEGFGPREQGFDVNIGGNQAGSPLSYFAPYRRRDRVMPGLEQAPEGEYLTDRLTAEAVRFIEQNQDRPFFLYLAHYAVHIPLAAKAELVAKYQDAPKTGPQTNAIYAAMIESVDAGIGQIMRKLEALNLADRTVVMFTSDNGGLSVKEGPNTPATSNAPWRAGKGYLYEGGIRVPLIVRCPGVVAPGSVCGAAVSSIDVAPTLLELAGVKGSQMDGRSLGPLLRQTGSLPARDLFWHYPHYSNQGGKPGGCVRSGNWKLIESFEDSHLELYDLAADPGETANMAEKLPARAAALRDKLAVWRDSINAQMMTPNPDYRAKAVAQELEAGEPKRGYNAWQKAGKPVAK